MNALNLYSIVEQDLGFDNEIEELYSTYLDIIDELQLKSVIDIGCGQGEFLVQIKSKKLDYLGVDLSSQQIEVCKSKGLYAKNIDIADVEQHFSCATAIFDVLNYIPANELESFLNSTYKILNKDGFFIFDVNTLFGFEEVAQGSLNIDKKAKFIAIDAFFENNILSTTINLFEKNKNNCYTKHKNTITQYYHTKDFLTKLLNKVGFSVVQIINFHLHSEDEEDKYIFICQK